MCQRNMIKFGTQILGSCVQAYSTFINLQLLRSKKTLSTWWMIIYSNLSMKCTSPSLDSCSVCSQVSMTRMNSCLRRLKESSKNVKQSSELELSMELFGKFSSDPQEQDSEVLSSLKSIFQSPLNLLKTPKLHQFKESLKCKEVQFESLMLPDLKFSKKKKKGLQEWMVMIMTTSITPWRAKLWPTLFWTVWPTPPSTWIDSLLTTSSPTCPSILASTPLRSTSHSLKPSSTSLQRKTSPVLKSFQPGSWVILTTKILTQ